MQSIFRLWLAATLCLFAPVAAHGQAAAGKPAAPHAVGCQAEEADFAWLPKALAKSRTAETTYVALEAALLPTIYVFDRRCLYVIPRGEIAKAVATPHAGDKVEIDGRTLSIGPISFADGSGSFVMSLPSVWRFKGVNGIFGPERLMDAVLLHEIMHTRQADLASKALDAVGKIKPENVDLSDDQFLAIDGCERISCI